MEKILCVAKTEKQLSEILESFIYVNSEDNLHVVYKLKGNGNYRDIHQWLITSHTKNYTIKFATLNDPRIMDEWYRFNYVMTAHSAKWEGTVLSYADSFKCLYLIDKIKRYSKIPDEFVHLVYEL